MNKSLYHASQHLYEAGMHMKGTFDEASIKFFQMSLRLADTIIPEEEKVDEDRMKEILGEIMQFGDNDGDK